MLKRHLQYKDINLEVVRLILKKNFDATTLDKREKDRIREQLEEAKCHISPDGPKYAWKNPHGQSEVYYWSCICLDIKARKGGSCLERSTTKARLTSLLTARSICIRGP